MKKHLSTLLLTLGTLITSTIFMPAKADITIATYNITHGKKNNWPKRQPGVSNVIKQLNADIYGFQEVIKGNKQLNTVKQALPDYAFVGQPRSSGIKGLSLWHRLTMLGGAQDEYCPIFYNQNKIELVTSGTFGINGKGWTSTFLPRICTFARFKEIATGKEFYAYNTHLDHKKESDRTMQIKLITDDIAQRCGNTPVIVMGDFNTPVAGDMQKALAGGSLDHGRTVAQQTEGPITTHLKKDIPVEIDHILVKAKDSFNVKRYKVLSSMGDTTSDHDPVSMTFSSN